MQRSKDKVSQGDCLKMERTTCFDVKSGGAELSLADDHNQIVTLNSKYYTRQFFCITRFESCAAVCHQK